MTRNLRTWLNDEDWVNIAAPKKNGKWRKCGEGPKDSVKVCRPRSVANRMTPSEIKSSVNRKRRSPKSKIKHAITASGKRRTQKSKRK